MSNNLPKGLLAACALALAWQASARADDLLSRTVDPKASPPTAPFVKQDGPISYTVSFVWNDLAGPPSDPAQRAGFDKTQRANPHIKTLSVEKVGSVRHDTLDWLYSTTTEAWHDGQGIFEKLPEAPDRVHLNRTTADVSSSFPELAWVNAARFVGAIPLSPTKRIDVYRLSQLTESTFMPFFYLTVPATAWIDGETRLPIAFQTSDFTARYAFGEAPAALDMPPEYRQADDLYHQKIVNAPQPP